MGAKGTKQDVYDALRSRIGLPHQELGPGSKERKETIDRICELFGLTSVATGTKQSVAAGIADKAMLEWTKKHESSGQTITTEGLRCLLLAVDVLAASPPTSDALRPGAKGAKFGAPFTASRGKGLDAGLETWRRLNLDQLDRSTRLHGQVVEELAAAVESIGHAPLRPILRVDPEFDLAWHGKRSIWVAEVKSMHADNAVQQGRLGLGQVLEYAAALGVWAGEPVVPVLASSQEPPGPCRRACERANVLVAWSGRFVEQLRDYTPRP